MSIQGTEEGGFPMHLQHIALLQLLHFQNMIRCKYSTIVKELNALKMYSNTC